MVRYADDFVCCFQYADDAYKFYHALQGRLQRFNLELSEEKTRVIPFGRYAEENCKRKGTGKPPMFDFLGFTHYCSQSKQGKFRVKRKTSEKKMRQKLQENNQWLKANRHQGMVTIAEKLKRVLVGYYNYYCITDNIHAVGKFRKEVMKQFFKWMNRRSQRKSLTWEKFNWFLKIMPIPEPSIKVSIYELRNHIRYAL